MKTAVYFGSRHIYADMIPAVKSLLHNSDVEQIYLLIEDDAFPWPLPPIVRVRNVSADLDVYFDRHGPNYRTPWTPMGLIRAALPFLFPELDRILSLDCDTIVDKDISELWAVDLNGCYFAAVPEPELSLIMNTPYANSGVMVMDLQLLRAGVASRIIDTLNLLPFRYVTQDAFNYNCQGHIHLLPSDYNVAFCTAPTDNKKIIHYAADPNWRSYELVQKYRNMPWSEVRSGLHDPV